jgi:hypothetical protein
MYSGKIAVPPGGGELVIQGDSYSFINILTSGRFRSQKTLDNKILSQTSKIGKNYHIGFFSTY